MDLRYLRFTGDRFFYDLPERMPRTPGTEYVLPAELSWNGWRHRAEREWFLVDPGLSLPIQGWKIHVSATLGNAQEVLARVANFAWRHRLSFKFAPSEDILLERNGKQAHRGSAGKFITLYPHDQTALENILTGLDDIVGGQPGPYVLSDLRWQQGPVYLRYGAFQTMTLREGGEDTPAILAPDGRLVPDRRESRFTVPPWVDVPEFLAAQQEALGDPGQPEDFPYLIRTAIHFSNGGGVYRADATGGVRGSVVLKEARPHSGLTLDGRDAVARLEREADILRRLADDPAVAALHDHFQAGDHHFIAMEDVDGIPLNKAMVMRNPLLRATSTLRDYLEYRDWALGIIAQLDSAISRLHTAGIGYGDLHPGNLLITDDDRLVLIDFEMSAPLAQNQPSLVGAPGFTPPARLTGAAADRWSLAAVKLFLFLPLTSLLALDPAKATQLVDAAARAFALPVALTAAITADLGATAPDRRTLGPTAAQADKVLTEWRTDSEDELLAVQVMLGRSIDTSLDLTRADRCYPGDPQQFRENGWNLAHGAAGVINAQLGSGLDISPETLTWLAGAADPSADRIDLGLYNGAAGVGWLWRRLGDNVRADRFLDRVLAETSAGLSHPERRLDADLYGGLSGIGVYLLDEQPAEALELCNAIACQLAGRMDSGTAFAVTGHRTGKGLMWGPSGLALFATRLYAHTGESAHLRLAQRALQQDLSSCVEAVDGSLQLDEGWRLMPYLAAGSGGVALAAAQLAEHVADPEPYLRAVAGIRRALHAPFTIESGVFSGKAGFIHLLVALDRMGLGEGESSRVLAAHVAALKLHALHHGDGIAFPGGGLIRASSDFATGTAGVLSAIQAYDMLAFDPGHDHWEHLLPLLLRPRASLSTSPSEPRDSRGGEHL